MRWITWPNAISILRLPLAVAFLALESGVARGVILALAALSDFFDGWLARRLGQTSRTGEVLDPVTDRAFLVLALASFAIDGTLPVWQLLVLLARDLYTAAAFSTVVLLRLPVRFRARMSGKVVTALQILAVLVLLVEPARIPAVVAVVGAAAGYAIWDYTRFGLRALRQPEARR